MRDISGGRLIEADLGWTTPVAMKSMLGQYNGTTNNSPGDRNCTSENRYGEVVSLIRAPAIAFFGGL